MFDYLKFVVLLLIGLCISSFADECPEGKCPTEKVCVDGNGLITMTVYYDNDATYDQAQWNAKMVSKACQARDFFPSEHFSVEFIIGAGTRRSDTNTLMAKNDVDADRRDGCAAKLINETTKFGNFVCCSNGADSADTDKECAMKEGVAEIDYDNCVAKCESDEYLMANGDKRRGAGIPGCHVPEFAFNGIVNRCVQIPEFEDLKKVLCGYYAYSNYLSTIGVCS